MEATILALLSCLAAGMEPGWLDAHDPVWERPPVEWKTGIPLANGHIGALVWGDGAPLKVTLDAYDAWETREKPLNGLTYAKLREMVRDGRKDEAVKCMQTEAVYGKDPYPTRLPMPRLEISGIEGLGAKQIDGRSLEGFSGRLSLYRAEAELTGRGVKARVVVPSGQRVVYMDFSGEGLGDAKVKVGFDHLSQKAKDTLAQWGYSAPETSEAADGGTLLQRTPSGYAYAVAWKRLNRKDGFTLAVSIVSSNDDPDPLAAAQKAAGAWATAEPDLSAHRAWWAKYWDKSWLTIPDARLEALYYMETYKLGCSSVPGGYPITLQGLWTLDGGLPPWSGDYHLDMNVQQSYWPIYAANRLDLGEPLYRMFSACLPRWQQQCQEFFGFDGAWAGCAIGPRGERIYGYSGVELWPGNAAWLAHHYWLHWLYSQDKVFLQEQALPMIRACFLTYANMLEKGEDGKLHVPMSYSPEYFEGSFESYVPDPTCDLALIRMLGKAILDSNAALGAEDALTPRVNEVLANLVDFPQRDNRVFVDANQPMERSHRHHSQLMMLHPLAVVSPEGSDAEKALIEGSLHQIRVLGPGQWTGWSFPWMSLIAGRAGYGNWAYQMLDVYANGFITPNTFHINGDPRIFGLSLFDYDPMTLEAGFGAAAAIQEMLLQSQGGVIRVFPSMPDRWHDAQFENLRAEGAFVVTAQMKDGKVRYVRIRSEAGGKCRIRNPFEKAPWLSRDPAEGKPAAEVVPKDGIIEFETAANSDYALFVPIMVSGSVPYVSEEESISFERDEAERHFYGVKRLARY
ncbi:MAG: hypothetical protein RBU21_16695 [FCB group bacterium]|jgi:alpha-L-fucosidase 2|nr:hypothetical protein [FCB group bacterium]